MEELIAKYFSGEATKDERSLVESWRSESKENATAFFESRIVWLESEQKKDNYQSILGSILDESDKEEPKVIMLSMPWVKYAAAAVLVFALGLLFILNQDGSNAPLV